MGHNMQLMSLLDRAAAAIGLNVNGLLAGIALAVFLMWTNSQPRAKPPGPGSSAAAGEAGAAAASGAGEAGSEAKGQAAEGGDVDSAAHKEQIDRLMSRAHHHRKAMNDEKFTVEHLVLALAENQRFTEILQCAEGLSEDQVKQAIRKSRIVFNRGTNNEELAPENQTALSKYSRDLTALAKEGKLDPCIGRSDELRRIVNILSRRTKNNPVILGDPGVGKTALVDGLAQRIVDGDVPDVLKGCTVVALDMGMLMAGAFMPGEFEERMKGVLRELTDASAGSHILFIDDIHTVTGPNAQQGGGVMDASILLKPLLSRGELRCIGATTLDKYRKFIEKDPALERRFQQVPIEQPTCPQTVSILRGLRTRYEKHHNVRIADKALVAAATLSDRYIADRYLPDKAIDLIDEATARVKMEKTLKPEVLDRMERRIRDLESERKMLRRTAALDRGDAESLAALEAELAALKERKAEVDGRYNHELGEVVQLAGIQDDLDRLNEEIDEAEEAGDEAAADRLRSTRREELLKKMRAAQAKVLEARSSKHVPVLSSRGEVTEADIANVISSWTGIPLTKLVESERDRLLLLTDELHKRIIGQEYAVNAVAEAIHRSRAGMKDPNGPIASFLFLGPTGVGKTELAKALASYLFNSEEAMVRLDMSEYMEKHAVSKLIGAPPGYVGFDEGGQLTEQVRRRPYTVVLFDEVEKAHVDVFNLLLQILDDGRVTDSQGRMVSFKNAIIIMTSNLGSNEIYRENAAAAKHAAKAPAGSPAAAAAAAAARPGKKDVKDLVMEEVRKHFKPEFVNRIDEFIVFEPLRSEEIHSIVKLRARGVISRMAERKIKLVLRGSAISHLAISGFNPVFGARPVKRVIQRELETTLARSLLKGEFQEGDTVVVSWRNGVDGMLFQRVPPGADMPPEEEEEQQQQQQEQAATSSSGGSAQTGRDPRDASVAAEAPHAATANGTGKPHEACSAGDKPAASVIPTSSRPMKFDPLRKMTELQKQGVDISKDGHAARSDPSTLPTSEG